MISNSKSHLKQSISEAISYLCKSHLQYGSSINIEGLIGITVDSTQIYLINIFESVDAITNRHLDKIINKSTYSNNVINSSDVENGLNNQWNVEGGKSNSSVFEGKLMKQIQCLPSFDVFASSDTSSSLINDLSKSQKTFDELKSFGEEGNSYSSNKLINYLNLNETISGETQTLNIIPSNDDFYDLPQIIDEAANKFISSVEDLVDLIGNKDANYEMDVNMSLINTSTFNAFHPIKHNWVNNSSRNMLYNEEQHKNIEAVKENINLNDEITELSDTSTNIDLPSSTLYSNIDQQNVSIFDNKNDKTLPDENRWSLLMLDTEAETLNGTSDRNLLLEKEIQVNGEFKSLLDEDDFASFDEMTFNEMVPLNLAGPQDLSIRISKGMLICVNCGRSFREKLKLKKHKCKSNLNIQNKSETSVILEPLNLKSQPIKPLDLTVSHTADGSLVYHRRSICGKSGETEEVVCVCGRSFLNYSLYEPHTTKCSRARMTPYRSCESCGKLLFSSSGYAKHRQKHIGIYKVKCQICKKGFFDQTQLKTHMDSKHSKVRRYSCPNMPCSKSFFWKHHLKRHLLVCSQINIDDEQKVIIENFSNYEDVPTKQIKIKSKSKKRKPLINYANSKPSTCDSLLYSNQSTNKPAVNSNNNIITFIPNSVHDLSINNQILFRPSLSYINLNSNNSIQNGNHIKASNKLMNDSNWATVQMHQNPVVKFNAESVNNCDLHSEKLDSIF